MTPARNQRQRPSLPTPTSAKTAKASQPSPSPSVNGNSNGDGRLWFTPDPEHPTAGADFVIISSDKVAFGVSEFVIRHR
jgi:hypothetical protein